MMPPLYVNVGENVVTGDTLGLTGNTGCAINSHLHFEIRKGNWFFDSNEPFAVDPFGWWNDSEDPIEQFRGNRSEWLWISNDLIDASVKMGFSKKKSLNRSLMIFIILYFKVYFATIDIA